MQRGIDHLVICVRNMQQAQSRYEALGFTLTPRALHPFGTANRLVQLQGNFLELLCIADPGAIESVRIDPATRTAEWTVIGAKKPTGICGSGIVDLCAELFRTGLIDRAGRFVAWPGAPFAGTAGGRAFLEADAARSGTGSPILFTAPDVKSVLRTKAALCAAADSLLFAAGLPRDAVERVYIAGGFGNFLDLRSALSLGMFPPFPLEKYLPLGNASLAGVIGAIRSRRRWREALSLAATAACHDLSSDGRFPEEYQRALFIPHADEERYRRLLAPEPGC